MTNTIRFRSLAMLGLAALLGSGCVSRAAMQRMQEQIDYIEASNKRMERDLMRIDSLTIESSENSRLARADVTTSLEDFRIEVQTMRETIDELRRSVDRRPPQVVYQAPPAGTTGGPGSTSGTPDVDPRQMYENAFLDVRKGNYELAIGQLRDLLSYYGESEYAPDAHYWIGECFYSLAGTGGDDVRHYYDSAVVEFTVLVENYQSSERLPTALYKLGRCYEELGEMRQSRRMYERVVDEFPKSLEAKPARNRLDQLR